MESGRKNIPNLKCVLMEVKLLNDLDKSAPFPRVCICPSFAMHRGYVLDPAFQEYEVNREKQN